MNKMANICHHIPFLFKYLAFMCISVKSAQSPLVPHISPLSALLSSPKLKVRGGVTCHRGTLTLSPNISCYSSLNKKWNRKGKRLCLLMW